MNIDHSTGRTHTRVSIIQLVTLTADVFEIALQKHALLRIIPAQKGLIPGLFCPSKPSVTRFASPRPTSTILRYTQTGPIMGATIKVHHHFL